MPYKDPERRKQAKRESARRAKERQRAERMVDGSLPGELPDPPSKDELMRILGVLARGGSVRAAELLLRRSDSVSDVFDPLAEFDDELAAKRANPFWRFTAEGRRHLAGCGEAEIDEFDELDNPKEMDDD